MDGHRATTPPFYGRKGGGGAPGGGPRGRCGGVATTHVDLVAAFVWEEGDGLLRVRSST